VDVLFLAVEFQMRWIDAQRVVAFVTHHLAERDPATVQFPREAMRLPPFRSRRAGMAERDLAVARNDTAGPLPAWTKFRTMSRDRPGAIDLRPEAIYDAGLPAPRDVATHGRMPNRFALYATIIIRSSDKTQ